MANTLVTNQKKIALALGAVTEMSYLYAGADKGIETEMQGKDNGDTIWYKTTQLGDPKFVEEISDNGSGDSLNLTSTSIKQATVAVKMNDSCIMYDVKAFERQVSSIGEALAKAKVGAKLGKKAVTKIIDKDVSTIGNVFVATQDNAFEVFQKAGAFLKGHVEGQLFGFMDWQIWGDLTGKGQQSVPSALANTPFGKDLKGSWTLIDQLRVISDISTFVAPDQPTYTGVNGKVVDGKLQLKGSGTIKAGDMFTVAGVYSKDVNDMATNKLFVFRVKSDITLATSYADVSASIANIQYGVEAYAKGWTLAKSADGSDIAVNDAAVTGLLTAKKTYASCIIRADGAQAFGVMKNCDCEGAKYSKSEYEGVTVHENAGENIAGLKTEKRFDMIFASKLVEPRASVLVLYPLS